MPVWTARNSEERPRAWRRRRAGRARLAGGVSLLLESLGSTPGEVAGSLVRTGVRAWADDETGTPVASLLRAVVCADPQVKALRADGETVRVRRRGWRRTVAVALPGPVRDFTQAFLAGCYPSLRGEPAPRAAASARPPDAGPLLAPGRPDQTSGQG